MYHSWLDRWDDRRAQRGNAVKGRTAFRLDPDLAFPSFEKEEIGIGGFCDLADQAVADASFFDQPTGSDLIFEWQNGWIEFPSDISTDTAENNLVRAKVTESKSQKHALIIFHHWNASARYRQIARFFSRRGITVVEIAMPYHFERSRPGSRYADAMLSPNLGRTIQSVHQAVLDGRKLIRVLEHRGYERISVMGLSLGSWVAGLVAANDPAVKKAVLCLAAGSLADMVWTGRATEHIRASLAGQIYLSQLNRAWGPLNLENYAEQLARPDLELQIVLAQRDTVVLPHLSQSLIAKLTEAGARADILELNCGHYSFALPPYILRSGLRTLRLLTG
ncbi:abhydrolase domain-containing 18 [Paracoccus liaowanqingii]|uniref:Abhydrolase domain-containing 18 n=1 Tax=Paracoccus liaowanqingii TaxID=2560053 RepID=A0A4Z1CSN6_9RHOB|nr:alpha/beta hydrolase family protein [Paracoccus liaowanqingii]TGN68340.1 abhydrolase domain-containing 18 [Paracoccus liaowanqingii]